MTGRVTWLHISDTHLCKEKDGWDSEDIFESFFDDLKYMKNEYDLYPDFVFFTGDVAFGHINDLCGLSLRDQYEEAKEFLERIREIFPNILPSNIFVVPGNHDVNRTQVLKSQTELLENLRKNKKKNGRNYVNELIESNNLEWKTFMKRLNEYKDFLVDSGYQHLLEDPDRLIYSTVRDINGVKVGIAGLNSAWSSYGGDEDKAKLWLGTYQISKARNKLRDTMLSIVLSHHPSNWFTDFEDLPISRKIENNFNFYLHGHEHQEWVTPINSHICIASGALYNGSEQKNGYNFVRIYPTEKRGEVFLRTYNNNTWIPNIIGNKTDNEGKWNIENLCININKAEEIERHKVNENLNNLKRANAVSSTSDNSDTYEWNLESLAKKIKDDILNNEQEFNILILGDVILDSTMYVIDAPYDQTAEHDDLLMNSVLITEETRINNLKITSSDRLSLGGAAGTMAALLEIPKVHVDMVGIIGEDLEGNEIKELFKNLNNSTHSKFYPVVIDEYPTVTKRYYHYVNRYTTGRVSATYRFDREDIELIKNIDEYEENFKISLKKIEKIAKKNDRKYDCIIINDYEKGMINNHIIKWLEKIQVKYQDTPIFVDPKYNFERYKNIKIKAIIPNIKEASMGIKKVAAIEDEDVQKRANDSDLNDKDYDTLKGYLFNCDSFIIKSDKKGATIYSKDYNYFKVSIPPFPIEFPIDSERDKNIGCGDTFDAYYIIGQLKGYSLQTSVNLANIAAGVKRKKELGEVVSPKEVYNEFISFLNQGSR